MQPQLAAPARAGRASWRGGQVGAASFAAGLTARSAACLANRHLDGLLDHLANLDLHLLLHRMGNHDNEELLGSFQPYDISQVVTCSLRVSVFVFRIRRTGTSLSPLLQLALSDRAGLESSARNGIRRLAASRCGPGSRSWQTLTVQVWTCGLQTWTWYVQGTWTVSIRRRSLPSARSPMLGYPAADRSNAWHPWQGPQALGPARERTPTGAGITCRHRPIFPMTFIHAMRYRFLDRHAMGFACDRALAGFAGRHHHRILLRLCRSKPAHRPCSSFVTLSDTSGTATW